MAYETTLYHLLTDYNFNHSFLFPHLSPVTLASFLFFQHAKHIPISWSFHLWCPYAWHALPPDFHMVHSVTSFKLCVNVTSSERPILISLSKTASLVTHSVFTLLYFPLLLLFLMLWYMYLFICFYLFIFFLSPL